MEGNLIERAERFATAAHKGQWRKWTVSPVEYIAHPAQVAEVMAAHWAATPVRVAGAWTHDVDEETDATIEEVERELGPEVAAIVVGMTEVSLGSKERRPVRKKMDREFWAEQSFEVKLLKLIDRVVNLREMAQSLVPADFLAMYKRESILLHDEVLTGIDEELEAELRELAI